MQLNVYFPQNIGSLVSLKPNIFLPEPPAVIPLLCANNPDFIP